MQGKVLGVGGIGKTGGRAAPRLGRHGVPARTVGEAPSGVCSAVDTLDGADATQARDGRS